MIEKINIHNVARQTGKTDILKLKAINASLKYYDKVIVSTKTTNWTTELTKYFESLYIDKSITGIKFKQIDCIKTDLLIANLKERDYKNVLLLLDEPFENDLQVQNNLLHFLEESKINFHVLGYGTLNTNFKTFRDYIK